MDGKILNSLVSLAHVVTPPQPWPFLPPSANILQFSGNKQDVVRKLQEACGENPHMSSILASDASGKPTLCPVLNAGAFLVVRQEKDGPPTDLVNLRGRLVDAEPPALHWSDDALTRIRAAKRGIVMVAFSDTDLATLRWLGLPVTSASGLATLSADHARRLLIEPTPALGDAPQTASPRPSPPQRPKLILAAVDLFGLRNQMPAGVLNVVTQLQRVERHLNLKTASTIGLWLPEPADFRGIRDAVHLADRRLVRNAITASVKQSTKSISEYLKMSSGPLPNDLPWAKQKLLDTLVALPKSLIGAQDVAARFEELSHAYDIAIIEQLTGDALASPDTMNKSLLMLAAELMKTHFDSCEVVQKAKAAIETGNSENTALTLDERLRMQCRLVSEMVRIKKAIEKTS
jgi:hypothetical protein